MCGISGHLGVSADEELIQRLCRCDHASAGSSSAPQGTPAVAQVGGAVLAVTAAGDAADRGPVTSLSGRHTLVLDGELYDTADLRGELTTLGHELGAGDAALVLAAYAEWGPEGLDRLEGSFALAVHDRDTDAVTLARDPFGTRQLYAARVGSGGWLFASTIRPILWSGHHERRPNDRTIYRYLCFRVHDDGPETFFEGIERVGAGESMTLTPDGGAERHLWSSLRDELEAAAGAPALRSTRRRGLPAPAHGGRCGAATRVGWARRSPAASTPPPSWRSSTVSPARRRLRSSTCSRRGRSSSPTRVPTRCVTSTTSSGPSVTGSRPIAWSRRRPTSRTTCATSCAFRRSRSSRPVPTPSSASCARPRRATHPRPPCSTGTAATRLSRGSARTTSSTCAS